MQVICAGDKTEEELIAEIPKIHAIGIRCACALLHSAALLMCHPNVQEQDQHHEESARCVCLLGCRLLMLNACLVDAASKLLCVGAFCIGTEQIECEYAGQHGVCVFNVRRGAWARAGHLVAFALHR